MKSRRPSCSTFCVADVGTDDPCTDVPDSQATESPGGESNEKHGSAEGSVSFPPGLGSVVFLEFIKTAITCGLQMK